MNFFKTFLAALLALVVGCVVMTLMWTLIMVGIVASMGSMSASKPIASDSVLQLDLGTIVDSPSASPLDGIDLMSMSSVKRTSLLSAINAIDAAAKDDRIEGIYMHFGENTGIDISSLEEIRAALQRFKESGKFIVAYEEYWSQIRYWFATVADKIYANPAGDLQWTGLSIEMMFFKGLLDKFDIEPIVVRHGSFKSAVEPFILDRMSPENRLQYQTMVGSLWNFILEGVSEARGIEIPALQLLADELAIDSPRAAVEMKMIDGLKYEDEVFDELSTLTETDLDEDPKIVSFSDYVAQITPARLSSKNKIAIVYAEGEIVSGNGGGGQVGSASMVEKLKKAADDDAVKAVVLRINSPGGSALASEVMWREIELLKAKKPVIVSMGSMAASGGYYIAAPGDAIYADRTTLTGSIGVFGLFANVGPALKSNLGVTTDVVKTNAYSDVGSMFHSPSAAELAYYQKAVEDTYGTFVGHVSEGRNMTFEEVDAIGQGRVWSGVNAMENGLIDGFGGLVDAVSLAADRVGVTDDFRIWEVTATPTGLEAFFSGLSSRIRTSVLRDELGESFRQYEYLRNTLESKEVQARMPYLIEVR